MSDVPRASGEVPVANGETIDRIEQVLRRFTKRSFDSLHRLTPRAPHDWPWWGAYRALRVIGASRGELFPVNRPFVVELARIVTNGLSHPTNGETRAEAVRRTAKALRRLEVHDRDIVGTLARHSAGEVRRERGELAREVFGLLREAGVRSRKLATLLVRPVLGDRNGTSPEVRLQSVSLLGPLLLRDDHLLRLAATDCETVCCGRRREALAMVIASYSELAFAEPDPIIRVVGLALEELPHFTPEDVVEVAFGLSAIAAVAPDLRPHVEPFIERFRTTWQLERLGPRIGRLLAAVQEFWSLTFNEKVTRIVRQSFIGYRRRRQASSLESEIESVLRRMRVSYRSEQMAGPFAVDFLVAQRGGRRVVLECDGSRYHMVRDVHTGSVLGRRGPDRLKDFVLTKRGFIMRRISSDRWNRVRNRKRYLRTLLRRS